MSKQPMTYSLEAGRTWIVRRYSLGATTLHYYGAGEHDTWTGNHDRAFHLTRETAEKIAAESKRMGYDALAVCE